MDDRPGALAESAAQVRGADARERLYIKRLADVDQGVLATMVRGSVAPVKRAGGRG